MALCYHLLSSFQDFLYYNHKHYPLSLDTGTLPASILIMSDESIKSLPDIMAIMASIAERMVQLQERLQYLHGHFPYSRPFCYGTLP